MTKVKISWYFFSKLENKNNLKRKNFINDKIFTVRVTKSMLFFQTFIWFKIMYQLFFFSNFCLVAQNRVINIKDLRKTPKSKV